MYFLLGLKETTQNIAQFVANSPGSPSSLKKAYRSRIKEFQPNNPVHDGESIRWCFDGQKTMELKKLFQVPPRATFSLKGIEPLDESSLLAAHQVRLMKSAKEKIAQLDPVLNDLIDLYLHTIFVAPAPSNSAASTSDLLGVVWADLMPTCREQDFVEFLYHQFLHNVLYLDEIVYRHYASLTVVDETYASSSLLRKRRPFRKALHSLVIGVELLMLRKKLTGNPPNPALHLPTEKLIQSSWESLESIQSNPIFNLLRERPLELIERVKIQLKDFENKRNTLFYRRLANVPPGGLH